MQKKTYISPNQLRLDSFRLAHKVYQSGWKPDFMVALWRGGAPIGCHVHEFFKWHGMDVDHVAIRTSRYIGIGKAEEEVRVHSLSYLLSTIQNGQRILLVDDVWDSGTTIKAFLARLASDLPADIQVEVRVASIYYKPKKNKLLPLKPNYFLHETDEWLVFPHELEDMTVEEVREHIGPEVADLLTK